MYVVCLSSINRLRKPLIRHDFSFVYELVLSIEERGIVVSVKKQDIGKGLV